MDKLSGKDFDRPQWRKLSEIIRPGDVLYIKSIDRLGRDYLEIQSQWNTLTKERGVKIKVIDMPILNTREGRELIEIFISDMVLQIQSFFAQLERDNIRQRQGEGIKSARARGIKFGRPKKKHRQTLPTLSTNGKQSNLPSKKYLSKQTWQAQHSTGF